MIRFKIIISLVLIFAMVFSIALMPSHAVVEEVIADAFFSWAIGKGLDYLSDKVAENQGLNQSSDCVHNWVRQSGIGGSSDGPIYVRYRCSTCGEEMNVNANSLHEAYNNYVDDLPAKSYDSDGCLYIRADEMPDFESYMDLFYYPGGIGASNRHIYCIHSTKESNPNKTFSVFFDCDNFSLYCRLNDDYSNFSLVSTLLYFSFTRPIDGLYSVVPGVGFLYSYISSDGTSDSKSGNYSSSTPTYYSAGSVCSFKSPQFYFNSSGNSRFLYFTANFYPATYKITPYSTITNEINATYSINTRTTNITGDVAYYDVNGTLQLAPSINIVNEGDKTYYNPVTNTTNVVNDWTYDYSDRSYTLNLDTGDTTTVTYGDEHITIQEGDTVYNVYYVTNNTQLPETHTHEWYQTGAKQATCTEYGTKTLTCSACGEQKTEALPALGHNWVQSGMVDAVVDEEGNETEPAYILYVCSRCGEEYMDYDGVGPPAPPEDPPSEDDSGGILAWLKEFKIWLGEKLDAITGGGDTEINNDYNITYVDEDGEEQDINVKSIADKFAWWKQVADIGQTFLAQVSASEAAAYAYAADGARAGPTGAPSIPLDLSRAQSYYGVDYGGEIEMLDLSWYTPYKKTVDDLVSGFMWLFFLWALFRRVPAIISGAGLTSSRLSDISSRNVGSVKGKGE